MTPVIFRLFKEDGELIAIFPTLPGGTPATCQSYMTVGQHADCNPYELIGAWHGPTIPVPKEEDYRELLDELKRLGYDDLKVYRKCRYEFHRERSEAMRSGG